MEPLPSDRRRALQIAGVVLAGALGTALVVGLLWFAFRPDPLPPAQSNIEPAEETSATTLPVTPSRPATDTTGSAQSTDTGAPTRQRAEKIAFRIGGTLYVANEDGSSPTKVARSASGPYALSPDGSTLAFIDGATLKLAATAGERVVAAGAAEAATPVWLPDSSAVLFIRFTGGSMQVWRASRDGSGARLLTDGSSVSISADGSAIAVRRESGAELGVGAVYVSRRGGAFGPITVNGQPTAVAVTKDSLVVGIVDASGKSSVVAMGFDGRGAKTLVGAPTGGVPGVWGELYASPDGALIAAVAVGDDGYSRVSLVPLNGGDQTKLSRRHDGYVRGWSAAGNELFLVEGNYFQGENTELVRVRTNGTNRRTIATGAE